VRSSSLCPPVFFELFFSPPPPPGAQIYALLFSYVTTKLLVLWLVVPLTDWFSANVLARGTETIDISIYLSVYLSIYLPTYLCVHMYIQRNIFIPACGPADRLVLGKRPRKGYGNYRYIYLSVYLLFIYLSIYVCICIYREKDVYRLTFPLTDWLSVNLLARGNEIIDL